MTSYHWTIVKISPLFLLFLASCRKDKPNIEITFCNGGMVPDTVTFSETNLDAGSYIWQLFDASGTALSDPTPTGAVNSIFARMDSAGNYRVKVDADSKSSGEVSFSIENYVTEGTQRAVSFFDSDLTVWTVYPDSDCRAAVRVKQVNGVGGIDFYLAANKLYYVAGNDLIFCFPNGEGLTQETSFRGLADICIVQSTGTVFIGTFGGEILQTTVANVQFAIADDEFDEEFFVTEAIEQLTYDPQSNTFFFTNGSNFVFTHEAIQGSQTQQSAFGSALTKTATVYDIENGRLYFAEGAGPCAIVGVDPDQPDQRLFVRQVPCDGPIRGMDIDEEELDIVYSDGANVWMIDINNPGNDLHLIADENRTIRLGVPAFAQPVRPPIADVVIARYQD